MSVLHKPERYLVKDYLANELKADVRHEYVEGHVYAMAGGTRRHNRITMNAGSPLLDAARGGNCEVSQSDVKVRVQNQVSDATERLTTQQSILETQIDSLEGVDASQAKVKIDTLTTQIEMSYSLTAKLLQMSLLNYA